MKKLLVLLLSAVLAMSFAGCTQAAFPAQAGGSAEAVEIKVMTLKGPTGIGMVEMMDRGSGDNAVEYEFSLAGSTDEVVAALSSGSADIAAIPTNLAANIYNKTGGDIRMLAVNTLGNLSILSSEAGIDGIDDLAGRTIHASGQGANPQYVLEHLLREAGLSPGKDVTIEYHAEHAELAALAASGEVGIAMLPEPYTSSVLAKNEGLAIAVDINAAWEGVAGHPLVMGCVVARSGFLEANGHAVQAFLADLEHSVGWAQNDIPDAASLCVQYDILADQAIAEEAIPRCGLTYLAGSAMKAAILPYFAVLEAANPASIGGGIPADAFFYEAGV